jgi:NAD(P)-dependent dehydrogenase (short-subunit alcohol dehydrogenase family)
MKYSAYQPRPDLLKDVLHGRTLNKLEVIYDEIESLGAPQPAILPLQLSSASERDYELLLDTLDRQFGRLDGILHNACILGERVPLADYPVNVWDDVMAVNLRAPFVMTQALLPLLSKSEHASVVFASSGVGREARERWGAYSVSKIAIEAVSQLFAKEQVHPNIRDNCINPGATRTAMRAKAYPNEDPKTLPTPDSIMPAYLYLMGNDSLHMNGQSIDAQD